MADDEKNIISEEDALAQQARSALPVAWQNGVSGETVARDTLIQRPTKRELSVFQNQRVRTCGDCRYFEHRHLGGNRGVVSRFVGMLWEEWGRGGENYVGDRPDRLGRCGQDAEVAVGPSSLACDHYKRK